MNTFQFHRHIPVQPFHSVLDLGGIGIFTGLAAHFLGAEDLAVTEFTQEERNMQRGVSCTFDLDLTNSTHTAIEFDFNSPPSLAKAHTFDLIYCLEVIENIAVDPATFLRELLRLIKPEGALIISTPNITSYSAMERIIAGKSPISYPFFRFDRSSDRHNIEYTPSDLFSLVEMSGFKVDKMITVNSWSCTDLAHQNFFYQNQISNENRGDNIFLYCIPSGQDPIEFPQHIYA